MADKPDPYATVQALIASAIVTAKVVGESARIVSLVVSSVGRLAAQLDAESASEGARPGQALVVFALDCVREGASSVPRLQQGLSTLLEAPIPSPSV